MQINGGDYLHAQLQNQRLVADTQVATGDSTTVTSLLAARNANYTVYVQRIVVSVVTDAAQSLIFQDSANTPVVIAKNKVSPGLGPLVFDFGPVGTPLTAGKNLDLAISGAGLAARVHIEGYQRQSAVTNANASSSLNA